jgi:hypothetical protein
MGLDMYLRGQKCFWPSYPDSNNDRKEDELPVVNIEVDLGYWRKHPDLHGFIVSTFAEQDDCEEIPLNPEAIRTIIEAIKERRLPKTTGFFFGESNGSEREMKEDLKIFTKALAWLEASDISPVSVSEPTPIGGGLMVMKIKPTATEDVTTFAGTSLNKQAATRSVYYRASW